MEMSVASRNKVSPKIRDRVPNGFYVDEKTRDVRLLGDLGSLDQVIQERKVHHPFGVAKDAAHALTAPRCQEKPSRPVKYHGRPLRILLVEDNPGDVRLVQEALQESKLSNTLSVLENGAKESTKQQHLE